MKYCINCGNELNGWEKFCTKCGTVIGGGETAPPKKSSHMVRNVLIICIILVMCGCGVFAANYATGGMLIGNKSVIPKMVNAISKTESCIFNYSFDFGLDVSEDGDSEYIDLSIDIDGDISDKDKKGCFDMTARSDGDTEKIDAYFEYGTDKLNFYINADDEWGNGIIDLTKYKTGLSGISNVGSLKGILKDTTVEKAEINGNKAYVIEANLDIGELSKLVINNTDYMDSLIEDAFGELELSKHDFQLIYEMLPDCRMEMYVDRETYLPIKAEINMKNTFNSIFDNVIDLISQYEDIDLDMTFDKCDMSIDFIGYNQSDITIPKDAYSGMNLGIIN